MTDRDVTAGPIPPRGPALDACLVEAYRRARYRVFDPPEAFVLQVDACSLRLAALIRRLPLRAAAYLTACNPGSEPRTTAENQVAMAQLRSELRAGRCARFLEAESSGPGGDWMETGLLALGISREPACALGRRWGQNAILYAGADAVPRLVLLR